MDSQLHDLLEDAVQGVPQRGDAADLARRARRRSRRRKGGAAATAMVVALLGVGLVLSTLRFDEGDAVATSAPSESPPTDVAVVASRLRPLWSVDIANASTVFGPQVVADRIYVTTVDGIAVYPSTCADPCRPIWRAQLGADVGGPIGPEMAVGDAEVALVDGAGLFVFDANCATDGSVCEPMWAVGPDPGSRFSSPSIVDGVVRVTVSRGESPQQQVGVVAYPTACGSPCVPLWSADMGLGTIHASVTVVDGVGYQQVGTTMYGFAAQCGTDGGTCAPDLVVRSDGNPGDETSSIYGPVGAGGELVFSAGDGSLYAYPKHCGTSCSPLWVGPASDFLESVPRLVGDTVFVSTGNAILGFPIGCRSDGGSCDPSVQVDVGGYAPIEVADEGAIVAAIHFGGPNAVISIPTDCRGVCSPIWTAIVDGHVYGATADGSAVYAGTAPDSIAVYPRQCSAECKPAIVRSVGGEAWWVFALEGRVIVGARHGGAGSVGMTLTAFSSR